MRLALERVSANYFDVLGVSRALRATASVADDADVASGAVVVISHALVARPIRCRPCRGRQLDSAERRHVHGRRRRTRGLPRQLARRARRCVGAARGLCVLGTNGNFLTERSARGLLLLGRLRPDVSLEQARARFTVVANQLLAQYPESWRDVNGRGRTLTVLPENESRVPPDLRGAIVGIAALLFTGVALVLLICCANVANLLLARGSRARERDRDPPLARCRSRPARSATHGGERPARGARLRRCNADCVRRGRPAASLSGAGAADPDDGRRRCRLARARLRAVGRGRRRGRIRSRAGVACHEAHDRGGVEGRGGHARCRLAVPAAQRVDHRTSRRVARAARERRVVPAQLAARRCSRSRLRRHQRRRRLVRSAHAGLRRNAGPSVLLRALRARARRCRACVP